MLSSRTYLLSSSLRFIEQTRLGTCPICPAFRANIDTSSAFFPYWVSRSALSPSSTNLLTCVRIPLCQCPFCIHTLIVQSTSRWLRGYRRWICGWAWRSSRVAGRPNLSQRAFSAACKSHIPHASFFRSEAYTLHETLQFLTKALTVCRHLRTLRLRLPFYIDLLSLEQVHSPGRIRPLLSSRSCCVPIG